MKMRDNFFAKCFGAASLALVLLAGAGCSTYQTETYVISDLDALACRYLQNDSARVVQTAALAQFDTTWSDSALDKNISAIFDSLETNGIVISTGDTVNQISLSNDYDITYAALNGEGGEVVLFFSDYIGINIYGDDGRRIALKSNSIPQETVFECPEIKTRLVYPLPGKKSLLQFIRGDQTVYRTFNEVILPNR